jgi:hypothetical protein
MVDLFGEYLDFTVHGYPEYNSASQGPAQAAYNKLQQQLFLGYLDFQGDQSFLRYNRQSYLQAQTNPSNTETFSFSLLDGEGGPGGNLIGNTSNPQAFNAFGWLGDEPPYEFGLEGSNLDQGLQATQEAIISSAAVLHKPSSGYSSAPRIIAIRLYEIDQIYTVSEQNTGTVTGPKSYKAYIDFGGPCFTGSITNSTSVNAFGPNLIYPISFIGGNHSSSFLPLMMGRGQGLAFTSSTTGAQNNIYSPSGQFTPFDKKHSHVEFLSLGFLMGGSSVGYEGIVDRTFKSSANHDFGIVYYDERGRHGFVNHLKTVYVPGYSQQERGTPQYGRSEITLDIQHDPPEWAHHYKIVYTKNTSVENFVQYTAGGAYLESNVEEGADIESATGDSTNIYVSLNYLQESPISYVSDWGARDPEGGLNMFKYLPGRNQKLKVISAYDYGNNRLYHFNYEFDIVDFVVLGSEENPLTSYPPDKPWKQGAFVVIRNNPNATGFDYETIRDQQSGYHDPNLWANNCVVELNTPARDHDRFYYEIGDTYSVEQPGTPAATHSETSITLSKGDVWWRKVPVNWREYAQMADNPTDQFKDLIQYSNDTSIANPSTSNFKSYYLESETASDLFKADASLIGRPNLISEDAVETRREASITYSEQSNPNSRIVNYSSFNLTLLNFKDLQEEFGDINYMCNMEGDVFVIQSDRCTLVPASKTLFSDVSGANTVAASQSPLGQEKIYAGRAGCDNNPESAVQVGSYVYFAHKNLGKIFRYNPSNGVQEISDQGMASYFRTLFQEAMASSQDINYNDIRVVGGFDPLQQEYLLTVLYDTTFEDALPGPVVDISYEDEQVSDYGTEDDLTDSIGEQQQVFLGRIPEGVEIDVYTNIDTWYYLLDGGMFSTMNFGVIERSPIGLQVTRDFYISNMSDEDVQVKIRPTFNLKFYADSKYPMQFGNGHYRNPSFVDIKNEAGITQVGSTGLENVKTTIPAGTYHTFTMRINVNEADHSYVGGFYDPTYQVDESEAAQYLIDTFGTTKRALTSSERAQGGENLPNEILASRPYYDSFGASTIEFEVYNMDDNLVAGVDDIGSWPYRRQNWRYQIQDAFEGNVVSESDGGTSGGTDDISAYSADLDGDGFVGTSDMLQLLSNFGVTGDDIVGDINNDGSVTVDDLLLLLNQFGGDAPNINDVIDVPTLNLDAFANAVINLSNQSQYGTTPIDLDSINTYADFLFAVPEGAINAILINQFSEVWSFIEDESDTINVLMQVYFVDENGDFIPYVSGETVSEAPPLDLCSYSFLQAPDGQLNVSTALGAYAILGEQGFVEQLPIQVQQYLTAIGQSTGVDLASIFILHYLTNEDGSSVQIQCNVGGSGGYG